MFKLPKWEIDWSKVFARRVRFVAIELAACAAVLVGVAHYSHPAAWILGGVGTILAIERQP